MPDGCLAASSGVPCPTGSGEVRSYCLNCLARMERRQTENRARTHALFMTCRPCRSLLADGQVDLDAWPAGLIVMHDRSHRPIERTA